MLAICVCVFRSVYIIDWLWFLVVVSLGANSSSATAAAWVRNELAKFAIGPRGWLVLVNGCFRNLNNLIGTNLQYGHLL